MRQQILELLIAIYKKFGRREKIKSLIKIIIGNYQILVNYEGFFVFAGIKTALESNVIFDNYNETFILKIIKLYAQNGYNFIDVGANSGLHSLSAASANTDIDIFSFEPDPINFSNFASNININKFYNITPFKMGVGDSIANKFLNINQGWNKGKHSLKLNFEGSLEKIKIPVSTLDSFTTYIGDNYLVIKIDVEGYEQEVINGAKYILEKAENIIVIVELLEENNSLDTCNQIVNDLKYSDFKIIYKIDYNNLTQVSEFNGSADYVFIKGDKTKDIIKLFM